MAKKRLALSIATLLLGSGAAMAAQPSTVEDAIRRLDSTLEGVPHVAPADLLADERSARYRAAHAVIRRKQCATTSANPVVLLSLPHVSVQARVHRDRVELADGAVDIPLDIGALSDLPDAYARQASARAAQASPALAKRLRSQLPRDYETLGSRVSFLIASFDPARCQGARRERPPETAFFIPPSF